jgi:hypothetical protein
MSAIRQNKTLNVGQGAEDRRVKRLATAFMSLLLVAVLGATGCSTGESGQTQTKVKPVVGTTRQDHALKVRIDNLCWSWKSQTPATPGETGAFSIEVEATIKNVGIYNLRPPRFSVDGGGLVSWYPAFCREDITHNQECKLCIANRNQVHLEFNNNDPGKEILLTVAATDKWGKSYTVSFTLPPPLDMPRCG